MEHPAHGPDGPTRAVLWMSRVNQPQVSKLGDRSSTPCKLIRPCVWAAGLAEPFAGPTVVVAHHDPHRQSLAPRFATEWVSTAYLSALPASFLEVPVLWVHGHTHSSHDYRVGNCRVVCNPRGYQTAAMPLPENVAFKPTLAAELPV